MVLQSSFKNRRANNESQSKAGNHPYWIVHPTKICSDFSLKIGLWNLLEEDVLTSNIAKENNIVISWFVGSCFEISRSDNTYSEAIEKLH